MRKTKTDLCLVSCIHLDAVEFLQLFDQRLGEGGLVFLRAKLVDEHLGILNVLLLILVGLFLPCTFILSPHLVFGVARFVIEEFDRCDFDGARGQVVQKRAVVRNQEDGA